MMNLYHDVFNYLRFIFYKERICGVRMPRHIESSCAIRDAKAALQVHSVANWLQVPDLDRTFGTSSPGIPVQVRAGPAFYRKLLLEMKMLASG